MTDRLLVYQYEKHPLVQLTDGRTPHTLDEHAKGWALRGNVEASVEGVGEISAVSSSKVLAQVRRDGWSQLNRFEIQAKWREKWVESR